MHSYEMHAFFITFTIYYFNIYYKINREKLLPLFANQFRIMVILLIILLPQCNFVTRKAVTGSILRRS